MARKNPGSGWEVDILWPDGETGVIKGFVAEYDALKWIAEHEYSKARPGSASDKSLQTHEGLQPARKIDADEPTDSPAGFLESGMGI